MAILYLERIHGSMELIKLFSTFPHLCASEINTRLEWWQSVDKVR